MMDPNEVQEGQQSFDAPQGDADVKITSASPESVNSEEPAITDHSAEEDILNLFDGEVEEGEGTAFEGSLKADAPESAPQTVDEASMLRERVDVLTRQLNELSAQAMKASGAASPADQRQFQFQPLDYVGDEDVAALLEDADPRVFKDFLNAKLNEAVYQSVVKAAEVTMLNIPRVTTEYIHHHGQLQRMVDQFYTQNQDLKDVSQLVGHVANDIIARNPQMPVEQVFGETAKRVREMTGLKAQAMQNTTNRPAFAGAGGSNRSAKAPSSRERDIQELLDL